MKYYKDIDNIVNDMISIGKEKNRETEKRENELMKEEIVKKGNDFYVKKELTKEEKIKVKKIDHKKALNFIAEYINYDMQSKDRLSEIQWLLEQVYQEADIEHIVDDWNLDDTEQWRDNMDIYKEEE